jgi:hypothetical protein
MNHHARLLAVVLAASASASGCSKMVDPAKNDPLKTAEGFCNSMQDVISKLDCDVFSQTGGRADPTAADAVLTSLRSRCDNLQAAVSAGRFVYDGSAAQGCIDAIEAVGCKGIFRGYMGGPAFPAACARVVKGNVAPGATCLDWNTQQGGTGLTLNECTQGSSCLWNDSNVCQSSCGFPSDVGEVCNRGNHSCKPNLFCGSDYKCYGYLGSGAACGGANQNCDTSYLYCDGSTCQYLPNSGPCRSGNLCYPGYYCSAGNCLSKTYPGSGVLCASVPCQDGSFCNGSTGFCTYFAGEGQDCSGGNRCGYPPYTATNLYCDAGSICRRFPTTFIQRGGDCYYLGSGYCADGLFCDSSGSSGPPNTCQPQKTSGTCTMDECAAGYTCQYAPSASPPGSFCMPLGRAGAPCDNMNGPYCISGTFCKTPDTMTSAGVCALLPGADQPCATTGMQQCAPGTYSVWTSSCMCKAYLDEGAACTYDNECGYMDTGRKCLANTCQAFQCITPVGWLAGSGRGGIP